MDERDRERLEEMPEHERRDIEGRSVGGGVMDSAGTAVNRGTGTLDGTAQGGMDDDVPDDAGAIVDDDVIVNSPADAGTLRDEAADR